MIMAAQEMVRYFHKKFGVPIGKKPQLADVELRCSLIAEEAQETMDAARAGDLPGAVDGLCDLIYVALGAAVRWGVSLDELFTEVHEANMRKDGGGSRPDGKILKPNGWRPPDIEGLLRKQGWRP